MSGLYSRLFTYRPRPERSPLEDFVTEAWADLLNRIPPSQRLNFCTNILLKNATDRERRRWREGIEYRCDPSNLVWRTQVVMDANNERDDTQGKRPDIVLFCDDKPLMIVENKIRAGFTYYEQCSENGVGAYANQLQIYGRWLAAKNISQSECAALVLLTAWTAAPPGLETDCESYGVATRAVIQWHEIHALLGSDDLPYWQEGDSDVGFLLDEFKTFLKEQEMVFHDPDKNDIESATAFLGAPYRRLYEAVANVGHHISPELRNADTGRLIGPTLDRSGLWLEQYISYSISPWISWGVRAQTPAEREAESILSAGPLFAYLSVSIKGSSWSDLLELEEYPCWRPLENGGWYSNILLCEINIVELLEGNAGFTDAYLRWLLEERNGESSILNQAIKIREKILAKLNLRDNQ